MKTLKSEYDYVEGQVKSNSQNIDYSQYNCRSVYLLKYFANANYLDKRYLDKCKFFYVVCSRYTL